MNKNRWRNYGLWVAIFAFLAMLAQTLGVTLPGNYDALVNAFLSILVLAGIISDPTVGKWYADTDKKDGE
jgi:uncharacterized membrane protein